MRVGDLVSSVRHYGELVVAAGCWGGGTVAAKFALRGIPSMTLLVVELAAATVVLWCVHLARGGGRPTGKYGRLFLLGLFEPGLAYAALTLGLMYTSASDASVLAGTESVFVVLLAAIFLHQPVSRRALAAVLTMMAGVAVLGGGAPSWNAGWSNLLVLAGALCAAVYVILASRIAPQLAAIPMTAYQFLAGSLVSLPFVVAQWSISGHVLPENATAAQWLAGVGAGVGGMALSFLLYNHAISRVEVTSAGMILNLIPIFGLVGAAVALGESIDGWQAAGASLVVVAMVLFTLSDRPRPAADTEATDPIVMAPIGSSGPRE